MTYPNGVILQPFQWYSSDRLWKTLIADAKKLAKRGFTAVWFPPPGKGQGGVNDVGYGAYDLFDLGEFDQKGAKRTKYGTKKEFVEAVKAVQKAGMSAYIDTVFNHKDGGEAEVVNAQQVDWENRSQPVSGWFPIQCFTAFDFPARKGKYSTMQWRWYHFDAVSYDGFHPEWGASRLFRLKDKGFATEVSTEHGNFDYLMACDIETSHPEVDGELRWWGRWIIDQTGADGFRIDACKHIRYSFFRDWLNHLRTHFGKKDLFGVGEYWSPDVEELHRYISNTESVMSLFDVPLHYKFHAASVSGSDFDMRTIFDRTLAKEEPTLAVTFVDNHDTQPLQSLESWVENWFKPLAYALILLRAEGYPCVFAGDLAKSKYTDRGRDGNMYDIELNDHSPIINKLLAARHQYNWGPQIDYFDHPNTIGWTRLGDGKHRGVMAVVMTNGTDGNKLMDVKRRNRVFVDVTGNVKQKVKTNATGWGDFKCAGKSVSVWVPA